MAKKYSLPISVGLLFLLAGFHAPLSAQRKSDLIREIDTLKTQLNEALGTIAELEKKVKVSEARTSEYESQVLELQQANATLLKNLNSFAEVSSKNTAAVNQALASLQEKENQLRFMTDAFSRNDSTAIVLLSQAKQSFGDQGSINVGGGALLVTQTLNFLFTEETGTKLTEASKPWLQKMAELLKQNPKMQLRIEGLSMTGQIGLAAEQATAVMQALNEAGLAYESMTAVGRDGNFSEGVRFAIEPEYRNFYQSVKSALKN